MDWLAFFRGLADALFKTFAYAVQEYPLPTALVFLLAVLIYFRRLKDEKHEPLSAMIIFVVAVLVANVVGWTFNFVLAALQKIFGWSELLVGPFAKNPGAFLLALLATLTVASAYLLIRNKFRWREIPLSSFALAGFTSLFLTYVVTNVYVQMADSHQFEAKTADKKK